MRAVSATESITAAGCVPLHHSLGVTSRKQGEPSLQLYVTDCSSETLLTICKMWILPSTTIISNCWGSYIHIGDEEPREGTSQPIQQKDTLHLLTHWVFGAICHTHTRWTPSPCLSITSEMFIGVCTPGTILLAILPPLRLCSLLPPPLTPPNNATLKLLCLISAEHFLALVSLYYRTAIKQNGMV